MGRRNANKECACVRTHGVKLHFLSPCHCCARDVGPDRSGWKMWSLFPSSSFCSSTSSPTISLKIAAKREGSKVEALSIGLPVVSTLLLPAQGGVVLWITPLLRILSASHAYLHDMWKCALFSLEARIFVRKCPIWVFFSCVLVVWNGFLAQSLRIRQLTLHLPTSETLTWRQ